MKKFTILITFLFIFLFTTNSAIADPYLSFKGGATFLTKETIATGKGIMIKQDYDTGFAVTGGLGYKFGDLSKGYRFRAEIEGIHAENGIGNTIKSTVIEVVVPCEPGEGCKTKKVQRIKDEAIGDGGGTIKKDFIFLNGFVDFPIVDSWIWYLGGGFGFDAWQGIIGTAYNFTPNWAATADFRYLIDDDYSNPMFLLGVQYQF